MKKLIVGGAIAAAVVAAILFAKKSQASVAPEEREARRGEKRREMFKKMQEGMEAMPEDFPLRVMFDNVAATRANSDRILELLEKDRSRTDEPVVAAAK